MTNVVSITTARKRRSTSYKEINDVQTEVQQAILGQRSLSDINVAEHSVILNDLDALADDMLIRKLALIHRQEADRRSWTLEEETMAAEMESAVYLAFRAGVPEEAIYDLDHTPLSDALNRAITKVGATA
jgi:hypothetical protein